MKISQLRARTVALVACAFMASSACGGGGEARQAEHIAKGEKFMAERNYAKARIEFRNALQIDPKDAQVRALVGLSNEKLENYRDAVNAYRLALDIDQTLEMPRSRLALIYASGGLYDEAMELIGPGLEQRPDSSGLLTARAVATAHKDLPAARLDAEKALKLDPKNEDAAAVLASLMWRMDERGQAIVVLEESTATIPDSMDLRMGLAQLLIGESRLTEAERHLAEIVRLDPDRIEHRFRLAQAYFLQGKKEQGIETLRAAVAAHPDSADAKVALAQAVADHHSFDAGEKELLAYLQTAKSDLDLRLAAGRFYESNNRNDAAESIYREVIESAGKRQQGVVARTRLAVLLVARGETDEAGKLLQKVLEDNPRDGSALAIRAEIAMRQANPAAAIVDLRAAAADQPDSVPLAVALARAYVRSGQTELAEQALRAVVQLNPGNLEARLALAQYLTEVGKGAQAQSTLEQLVAAQPNNAAALEALAKVQLTSGRYGAAQQTAAQLQALQPRSAMGHLLAGTALQAENKPKDARTAYERALQVDPMSRDALVALVRLDMAEGEAVRALERVDRAIASHPGNAFLLALRGDVLLTQRRIDDAIGSYAKAVAAAPDWTQGYLGLANAYQTAGKPDEVVASLRKGFEATQRSTTIGMRLAATLRQQDRVDDAIEVYEQMLAIRPDDDVVVNSLAMTLADHREDAASLARAERLAERFATSDSAPMLDTYGWVLYRRGKYADAEAILTKAVDKGAEAPELRFHLGMTQLKLGKVDAARRNLESALKQRADFPGAAEAKRALSEM